MDVSCCMNSRETHTCTAGLQHESAEQSAGLQGHEQVIPCLCSRSVSWGEEGLRDLRSPDAVNAALYILCMCPCRSARTSSMCFMCSRRTPGGTEQPCMQRRPRHRPRSPVSTGVRSLKGHAPGTVQSKTKTRLQWKTCCCGYLTDAALRLRAGLMQAYICEQTLAQPPSGPPRPKGRPAC